MKLLKPFLLVLAGVLIAVSLFSFKNTKENKEGSYDYAIVYLAFDHDYHSLLQIKYSDGTFEDYAKNNNLKFPVLIDSTSKYIFEVFAYLNEKGYELKSSGISSEFRVAEGRYTIQNPYSAVREFYFIRKK